MRTWTQQVLAPAPAAWALIARPSEWNRWAPHVGGAWGLGDPEVEAGKRGFARFLGFVPVPSKVTQVTAGVSWSWRVGPMTLHHLVEPLTGIPDAQQGNAGGEACEVTMAMEAPGPIEPALAETYGRAFPLLLRRLAREAESSLPSG